MSRRFVPAIAGVLATAFFGGFAFGSPVSSLVVAGPALSLLAYVLLTRRRAPTAESRWSAPSLSPPVLAVPGSGRQVAAALGRVESRELVFSVWFGVGLGFLAVIFLALAVIYADDNGEVWMVAAGLSPWFAHPLAGMTVLAVHRAVTRPARDGTDELFAACPTDPAVRIVAVLRTAAVPMAIFAAFLVVYGTAVAIRSSALHGPVSVDAVPVVLAGPVLTAGAVFLGAALGSWVRFGLAPVVAVVGVGMLAIRLATAGDPGWNGSSALSTMGPQADSPLLLSLLPTWWYLAWIVGLAAVVAVVAVLRFRRDPLVWRAGAAALALVVVAAFFATRPVDSGEAQRVADLVARPQEHQTCAGRAGADIEVCTYDGYGELRDKVAAAVTPIRRALPDEAGLITIRQGFDGALDELPPEVRERLETGVAAPGAGELRIGFAAGDGALREYRLQLVFTVLGLPLEADAGNRPVDISGQARGVVALWLAARGLDLDEALDLASADGEAGDAFERGLAWPTGCGPVVWSAQDLEAARVLMRAPEADLGPAVAANLERWSDPAMTTDGLLAELGLAGVGPHEAFVTRVESFC